MIILLPYVRWTEKRNFEAVLAALSKAKLDVKSLITERVVLDNYAKIYNNIGTSNSIASILVYPDNSNYKSNVQIGSNKFDKEAGSIGIIGAGNFTKMTLLPALKNSSVNIKYIASSSGVTGTFLAKKYSIMNSTTNYSDILTDNDIGLIIITTRHNSHAKLVIESLEAGKNVFVEKPLALNDDELENIISAYKKVE